MSTSETPLVIGGSPTPVSSTAVYATYFDHGYLPRALTLLDSLREHGDYSDVWILCLDDETHEFLSHAQRSNVHLIELKKLEDSHPELLAPKKARSKAEYIFTIGPTFLLDLLRNQLEDGQVLVYLDADLYFFDDPKLVLRDLANSSVGIIEHRYSAKLQSKLAKYGRFNVGWVGFRKNDSGEAVLSWWAANCIEWCFDKPEPGRYADQGYLDSFPNFSSVRILGSAGFNLAPWNTGRHEIRLAAHDGVQVDGSPLVFFHFHGIKETKNWFITSQLVYRSPAGSVLREHVYAPYLHQLQFNQALVSRAANLEAKVNKSRGRGLRGVLFGLKLRAISLLSIVSGNAVRKSREQFSESQNQD